MNLHIQREVERELANLINTPKIASTLSVCAKLIVVVRHR